MALLSSWLPLALTLVGAPVDGLAAAPPPTTARSLALLSLVMPTDSMFPTLMAGDRMYVDTAARVPRRGAVIVFRYPRDPLAWYVKRVVGLPGDVVEIDDGHVRVNGQEWPRTLLRKHCSTGPDGAPIIEVGVPCVVWRESADGKRYLIATDTTLGEANFARTVVPPEHVFVLGDNRENSSDSRVWGTVDFKLIEGTVRFIWYATGVRPSRAGLPVR